MNKHARDLVLAITMSALAAAYLLSTFSIRHVDIVDPLGPKAFPALVGFAMLACGLALGSKAILQLTAFAVPSGGDDEAQKGHPVAVTLVGAWLLAYYLVYEPLGFIISTVLFLLGLTAYFNRGKWIANIAVAVGFPVVLDLLFSYALGRSPAPGLLSF